MVSVHPKVKKLFKLGWDKSVEKSKDGLEKTKTKIQHAAGLGHRPNVIPEGDVDISGEPRVVEIGWHPVAGFAGKWFAEQTGLGKLITEKVHKLPDPTQHWAVLVGGYVHQLWMDENLHVIYINEELKKEEWHTFEVGKTRFNDEALRQAGELVIHNMREMKPAYNLIDNNCQNFATLMLEKVKIGSHREFATALAIYQRVTGAGKVKDLFVEDHPDDNPNQRPATPPEGTVNLAQKVMDENTTKLDSHTPHIHT